MTEHDMIIAFLLTAILCAAVALCFVTAAYNRQRRRASRLGEKASLAIATAQKHESVMAEAVPALRTLATLAERAKCDMDAARFRSLANAMQYAVGMAAKLKEVK